MGFTLSSSHNLLKQGDTYDKQSINTYERTTKGPNYLTPNFFVDYNMNDIKEPKKWQKFLERKKLL